MDLPVHDAYDSLGRIPAGRGSAAPYLSRTPYLTDVQTQCLLLSHVASILGDGPLIIEVLSFVTCDFLSSGISVA